MTLPHLVQGPCDLGLVIDVDLQLALSPHIKLVPVPEFGRDGGGEDGLEFIGNPRQDEDQGATEYQPDAGSGADGVGQRACPFGQPCHLGACRFRAAMMEISLRQKLVVLSFDQAACLSMGHERALQGMAYGVEGEIVLRGP